jgi:hypothetical protein
MKGKFTPKQAMRLAFALLGATSAQGLADTATLPPVADTSLFEFEPNNNFGASGNLPVGTIFTGFRCRLLLRFDVAAALPPAATVTRASLTMTVVSIKDTGPANSNFQLHRMLVPWVEGNKAGQEGQPAAAGETTWNARLAPAVLWSQPGAAAPADFSPQVSGSTLFLGPGDYTFASNSNLVADVQFWLQHSNSNFGWILVSDQEATPATARRIDSRENRGYPPTLTVEFSAPQPPQIDGITHVQDHVQIFFPLPANAVYDVQYKTSLGTQTWWPLTRLGPNAFPTNAVVEDSISPGNFRCYRVGTAP